MPQAGINSLTEEPLENICLSHSKDIGEVTTQAYVGFLCEIGVMVKARRTPELPRRWISGHAWVITLIVLIEMERLAHCGLCHSMVGTLPCINHERELSSLCVHHCLFLIVDVL